jgi:hypothetical protein
MASAAKTISDRKSAASPVKRSVAKLLQRQPIIRDLDLHFGGRWRPLIRPQEYDSGRKQHDDGDDEPDDDPIHIQVLEIMRFVRGFFARVDGW